VTECRLDRSEGLTITPVQWEWQWWRH